MSAKYLIFENGLHSEKNGLEESSGAADEGRIPRTLSNGRIADTIMSRQPIGMSSGGADTGNIPVLNSSGFLDNSLLPVGVGNNTYVVKAAVALAADKLINVYSDVGELKARLADATLGRQADGFTKNPVAVGELFTLYSEGPMAGDNLAQMALPVWLGQAGLQTRTPSTTPGHILQRVGTGISSTDFIFKPSLPIRLA